MHTVLMILMMFGFYMLCKDLLQFLKKLCIKATTVPVYKKQPAVHNGYKWIQMPMIESGRAFNLDKMMNHVVLLMFVSIAIWIIM